MLKTYPFLKHFFFKNLFFPSAVIEWNSLDLTTTFEKSEALLRQYPEIYQANPQ